MHQLIMIGGFLLVIALVSAEGLAKWYPHSNNGWKVRIAITIAMLIMAVAGVIMIGVGVWTVR